MTVTEERLAELKAKYPAWHLWYVSAVYGDGTWCAMPAGAKIAAVNKGTANQLDAWLSEQQP